MSEQVSTLITENTTPNSAIGALRDAGLRRVVAADHGVVLRLLADRQHDLVALRTQAICRLHALLCRLIAGGLPRQLNADRAARALRSVRPTELVDVERKRMAAELLADVRRFDQQLVASRQRIEAAVVASATTVTDVFGVGPIVAAIIIGHTGDVRRFPTAGTSPATTAPHRSKRRRDRRAAPAQPAREPPTQPRASTSPRSPRSATTHPAAPTTSANKPKGRPGRKRSAR